MPSTPRVLVADADADTRARFRDAFSAAGCDVTAASDGHEALVHALTDRPTLVLTDLHLPFFDGCALCEVLRRNKTTSHVPIVIVTDETRAAELERAERAGADAVLRKPAALHDILGESRRLLAYASELQNQSDAVRRRLMDQLEKSARLRVRAEQHRQPLAKQLSMTDLRSKNRLLAALSPEDRGRLGPHLKTMRVQRKQVLHKQGDTIRHVYFPNGGVYSIVTVLAGGAMVEVATVGDEGIVGIEAFFEDRPIAMAEAVLQVPDTDALVMSLADFRRELRAGGSFHRAVARYLRVLVAQVAQSVACNALHSVRQRCARWLLTTADRVHQRTFEVSHEFLAAMLAVSRPTVSEVAAELQREGLITYAHRQMRVTDRKRLEAESCECYSTLRAEFDKFLQDIEAPVA